MTNPPAGWYPDPEYSGQQRYWDGSAWTVNRAPSGPGTPRDTSRARNDAAEGARPSRDSSLATLALILAIIGFVFGVIPFAAWIAWLLFVPALVLAIRALVKGQAGKGQSISAISVASVGWLIALVVGIASFGIVGGSTSDAEPAALPTAAHTTAPSPTAAPTPTSAVPSPAPSSPPPVPGIGQSVASRSGVSFTVTGVQCGLGTQDDVFGTVTPKGQFCKVDFVVANGSSQPQNVSAWDVYGYIGNARYEADTSLGSFGEDSFSTTVNPGLSVNCSVYFDVPAGAGLDRVKLITSWWGGDGATVTLR
ncbi:DUF4352 domain-containing protein [Leifsonia sp. NPDC014704]|uniref:DUF4352 domain-containing protein n=1 Tax=Leifsonia sp. NPDC014704 TaxID=3364123 RepID=UPI0036F46DEB